MKLVLTLFAYILFQGYLEAADSIYYFTTFGGDKDQKLYIYSSLDGENFSLFDYTGFGGPTGILRDPGFMYYNGKYYIAFTTESWNTSSTSFAIASSSNLLCWTTIATVNCGIPGTYYTWAPDWFVDSCKIKLIVNIGSGDSSMKPYIFTANDNTLTSWSSPVDMGIGTNHIDAFVVKSDGTYYCFSKDENSKNIVSATASRLTGPWTLKSVLWNGYEGVCVIKSDNGMWRIYIDHYSVGDGLYTATSSDLNIWSSLSKLNFGRHGACLKTTSKFKVPD